MINGEVGHHYEALFKCYCRRLWTDCGPVVENEWSATELSLMRTARTNEQPARDTCCHSRLIPCCKT